MSRTFLLLPRCSTSRGEAVSFLGSTGSKPQPRSACSSSRGHATFGGEQVEGEAPAAVTSRGSSSKTLVRLPVAGHCRVSGDRRTLESSAWMTCLQPFAAPYSPRRNGEICSRPTLPTCTLHPPTRRTCRPAPVAVARPRYDHPPSASPLPGRRQQHIDLLDVGILPPPLPAAGETSVIPNVQKDNSRREGAREDCN